jgi:hypothetical protein
MSLVALANHLAEKGRGDDKMLVHMTPGEVQGLQALALAHGGSLTVNPETGLVEAGWLKKLLPAIAGFALNFIAPGVGTAIGGMLGLGGAAGTAIAVGGLTGLATGSLRQGIMAGLGAYGGASLAGGVQAAGASAAQQAAVSEAAKQQAAGVMVDEALTSQGIQNLAAQQATKDYLAKGALDKFTGGVGALGTEAGRSAFMQGVGGASGLFKAGTAAMLGADAFVPTATSMPSGGGFQYPPRIRPMSWNQYTGGLEQLPMFSAINKAGTAPAPAPAQPQEEQPPGGMAGGGIVALAAGGPSLPSDVGTYTPEQKADLYNKFLSQGFTDAAIRQAAGQQTDENWQALQRIAAQRGSPDVSGAERTVLTDPNWKSISGQTGISGLNQNIQNFVQQNPNISYEQVQAAANQYGVDAADIRRAVEAGGGSGGMQNVLTQADWRSRTGLTGLEGMNKNIQMWMAENPQATEAQIRQAMQAVNINDADVIRATGKSVAELAYKPPAPKPPVTAVSPTFTETDTGTTITPAPLPGLPDFAPTTPTLLPATKFTPQTMEQVRTAYEQGGGATRMPTITDIKPGERAYTQNEVVGLLSGFLKSNPNAEYSQITQFAASKGIPEYQARSAFNELRFSSMTGGSKSAYDYLMGRGAYPVNQVLPNNAPLMRPYLEASGISTAGDFFGRKTIPTTPTRQTAQSAGTGSTTASGVTGGGTSTTGGNTSAAFIGKTGGANTVVTGDNRTYADQATIKGGVVVGNNVVDPVSGRVIGTLTANVDDGTGGIVVGSVIVDPISGRIIGQTEDAGVISRLVDKKVGEDLAPIEDRTINLLPERQPERSEGDDDVYSIFRQPNSSFWFDDYGAYSRGMENADITPFNSGGITTLAGAAKGGQFNLGGYSDGGRLLRGPGDGVSDSIPAVIGNRQPARLADGEFVIPARIVSELGNGSTEAGARKLYAMMDRVQRARAKTTGKGRVAKNTRADKHLPA